ncbi:MAG TPA: Wzz/FepE/Etk N-terminal domain-containing protein [Dehalococcoidia bacterium]|nr:Wzz/FepE/Etk N-terminal domain-containing protein [Dehalococcoidia bacterium]
MEFDRLIDIVRRRWWLVVLAAVVAGGLAFAVTQTQPDKYRASASLRMGQFPERPEKSDKNPNKNNAAREDQARAFAKLVTGEAVLSEAAQDLGLSGAASLRHKVTATAYDDTTRVRIVGIDRNRDRAAEIANAVAQATIDLNPDQLGNPALVTLEEPATPPKRPATPDVKVNTVLGMMVGLVLACLAIAFLEYWPRMANPAARPRFGTGHASDR